MSDLPPSSSAFKVVKGLINAYDLVTLPLYAIVQQPWQTRAKFSAVRARQLDPSDPYSPWVRNGTAPKSLVDECKTIDDVMRTSIEKYRHKRCMGTRPLLAEEQQTQADGKVFVKKTMAAHYEWQSYDQVDKRIDHIARGLLLVGVKPKDRVIIFMETRCEWMLAAQALFRVGATLATVYATLGDEGILHVINEVEASHIITSSELLPKLEKLNDRMPLLTTVIYVDTTVKGDFKPPAMKRLRLVLYSDMERDGSAADPSLKGEKPKADDIALIMYTSGSTGAPKGVMAWHSNFVAAIKALYTVLSQIENFILEDDNYIGYLPLAHNLEFTTEHLLMSLGIPVGYSSPFTMTDKSPQVAQGCVGDASLLKPGALAGVPLILDRIRKGVDEQMSSKSVFFQNMFMFAMDYKNKWNSRGYRTPLIDRLVCKKVKMALGGRIMFIFCGGAPLSSDTQAFAQACMDVRLMQGYATTETTAVATLMDPYDINYGRTGSPLFGAQVRLIDWDEGGYHPTDKPRPRGEIVVGGDAVTAGYFKLDSQTEEVYRNENGVRWFYTGDIGEFYPDGTLKIIDRKKDLLKLQHGEYVSLGKVEAELKTSKLVDNICCYGDSFSTHLVALVIPNEHAVRALAARLGLDSGAKWPTLCKDKRLVEEVTQLVMQHGRKAALHKTEIPTRLKLCTEEWTPDSGLATAALKIRRKPLQTFYQSDIDAMYGKVTDTLDANRNLVS